jgi:NTP pyrophosphatase (non-canonical NTP hydrolase)
MMTVKQFYLAKLAEECAEVAQRALKQIQFGKEEAQANGPSTTKIMDTNAERLRKEINDLIVVVNILEEQGEIPTINYTSDWADISKAKREKLAKYLAYSQNLGMVETPESEAKKAMKDMLPIIFKLLENPTFIKTIEDKGYEFDSNAIFRTFKDAKNGK